MVITSPRTGPTSISFDAHPSTYRHWKLNIDGAIATLSMDVQEDAGLFPDYKLKLNSYDLGVDIELADAIQRLRFEHPEVRTVVITSLKERIFCAGANIFMLRGSTHAWKVNFCKFTNETRLAIEDASANSGIKFLAALNGICAGGGYELAPSMKMLAPAQKMRSFRLVSTTAFTSGCSKRRRWSASASSMSTPRS